jgi:hypothetical protein
MLDPIPDCAITLYFYEGKPATEGNPPTPPRFSYSCTNSARGWHVEADGSIHPPSKSRIILISLNGFPTSVAFAGLQFSPTNSFPDEPHWTAESTLIDFAVAVAISDNVYPPSDGLTNGPLILAFNAPARLFYRLAVQDASGSLIWDDPKIYDDGSQ